MYVTDPALAQLRSIMAAAGEKPAPNHHGTVAEDADLGNGIVLINFDDGGAAPYPIAEVQRLTEESPLTTRRSCYAGDCDLDNGHDGPHTAWVPE